MIELVIAATCLGCGQGAGPQSHTTPAPVPVSQPLLETDPGRVRLTFTLVASSAQVTLLAEARQAAQDGWPAPGSTQSKCRGTDTTSTFRLEYLKRLVSDSHPDYANVRLSTGLPATSPAKVQLETRAAVCQTGADGINAARDEPGTIRQVWVFTLDTWYAVVDPSIQVGPERIVPYYLFDHRFAYKVTLIVQ